MTNLEKPIHRKTRGAYPTLYVRPRQIVVSLLPGDFIEFRELGRRKRFRAPIDGIFKHVIRLQVLADAAEKRKQKKLKRLGR